MIADIHSVVAVAFDVFIGDFVSPVWIVVAHHMDIDPFSVFPELHLAVQAYCSVWSFHCSTVIRYFL